MSGKLPATAAGVVFGFVLAWARVTDPAVIHAMLALKEPDVFLLMGSAIVTAAVGTRLLRAAGARAWVTAEPIAWTLVPTSSRHVIGSAIFGAGWSVAATCPGPVTAMIGEGHLGGLVVVAGLLLGILIEGRFVAPQAVSAIPVASPDSGCV